MPTKTKRLRSETNATLLDAGIIAILRVQDATVVPPLAAALVEGGIRILEVTWTNPDPHESIQVLKTKLPSDILIGAGSILTAGSLRSAIQAGADFIVTPITRPGLVQLSHEEDRPILVGALTPTECQNAHDAGADFIKIFPADCYGPEYLKSLHAPLPHLRLAPTGGISAENLSDYLKAGASLAGLGSSLISKAALEKKNWKEITRASEELTAIFRKVRTSG
jgi:2-dehydro-3-deoxyphosphogluconate aldolase / (4S)-4-hydroxy-2-oxoglutarate aldolase